MVQRENLLSVEAWGDKTSFTDGVISIIVDKIACCNNKHYLLEPRAAEARFSCCGDSYTVENVGALPTVEDWYEEKLLPKVQMPNRLLSAQSLNTNAYDSGIV
jgi:hypothetical protein